MLNYIVIAAAGVMGWTGYAWWWIVPLALLAAAATLVFPPSRFANLRARGAFGQVFLGALPIQTGLVVLLWLLGHFIHPLI